MLMLLLYVLQTTNLIINFDHDEEWTLEDDTATLLSVGIGEWTDIHSLSIHGYTRQTRSLTSPAVFKKTKRNSRSSTRPPTRSSS